MILRRFLPWAQTASALRRADAAATLVRAWGEVDLAENARLEAERTMMALLDDPAPLVRQRLAACLAEEKLAPRSLVSALACDHSDIAAPLLAGSELLTDAELVEIAATGDSVAREMIAQRPGLPSCVCAALAEFGPPAAAISMAKNPGAKIANSSLRRLAARWGGLPELRAALLARKNLPAIARDELIATTPNDLRPVAGAPGWFGETRETLASRAPRDSADVLIAVDSAEATGTGLIDFVARLRRSQQLTASLMLRGLLTGQRQLFEAALLEISGVKARKLFALLRHPNGAGFAALLSRAGLPPEYLPAFRAALNVERRHRKTQTDLKYGPRLCRAMIENVLAVCDILDDGERDRLRALLRRFELEAALEDARDNIRRLEQSAVTEMTFASRQPPVSAEHGPPIDLTAQETELFTAGAQDTATESAHPP